MAITRWKFVRPDESAVRKISEKLGVSLLTASALVSRGIDCVDAAEKFIAHEYTIEEPFLLKDIEKAVERIKRAVDSNECIVVFGDYDVDGIMSTAMVYQYLESIGANVIALLPERDDSGYGLAKSSVDLVAEMGASLIITVDNGVSSYEAVMHAKRRDIDTVICDHHRTPELLPEAVAIIDPLRKDDVSSFKKLAGVGVALKLISAVEGCSVEEMLDIYGEFAAIGTIADVVPLVGENRIIVSRGLEQLSLQQNPGLTALLEETNLADKKITAQDTAFTLIPRLNAAGRMSSSKKALDMLTVDDVEVVQELAKELGEFNSMRQKAEQEMLECINEKIKSNPEILNAPVLVVYGNEYNSGVSGIVCSKLVDRYGKPSLVIAVDKNEAKGSARSIEGFSMYDAIAYCEEFLKSFGGHDMAAGFTLDSEKIEEFKTHLFEYCINSDQMMPYKSITICREIDFSEINEQSVKELEMLAPFGTGNEDPVFFTPGVYIKEIEALSDKHSRIAFESKGQILRAALFQTPPSRLCFNVDDRVDIAYVISLYTSQNGNIYVSAKLKGIVPYGFSGQDYEGAVIFESFKYGKKITVEQRKQILPGRDDIAYIYRSIKEKPIADDCNGQICFRFPDIEPGKALASVAILKELELVEVSEKNDANVISVVKDPEKRDLMQSEIFSRLSSSEDK